MDWSLTLTLLILGLMSVLVFSSPLLVMFMVRRKKKPRANFLEMRDRLEQGTFGGDHLFGHPGFFFHDLQLKMDWENILLVVPAEKEWPASQPFSVMRSRYHLGLRVWKLRNFRYLLHMIFSPRWQLDKFSDRFRRKVAIVHNRGGAFRKNVTPDLEKLLSEMIDDGFVGFDFYGNYIQALFPLQIISGDEGGVEFEANLRKYQKLIEHYAERISDGADLKPYWFQVPSSDPTERVD